MSFLPQVNFLHSLDNLYHPSHLLASQQQFLHPSHHAGELSGHTLPNPHRNSGNKASSFPVTFSICCNHLEGVWLFASTLVLLTLASTVFRAVRAVTAHEH